jgi:hypothetical protein
MSRRTKPFAKPLVKVVLAAGLALVVWFETTLH